MAVSTAVRTIRDSQWRVLFSVFGSPAGTSGSGGSFTVRDTTNGSGTIIMFTRTLAGNTDAAFEVYDPPRAVLVGVDIGDRWPEERESGMSIAGSRFGSGGAGQSKPEMKLRPREGRPGNRERISKDGTFRARLPSRTFHSTSTIDAN